ncbi:hypothetical protein PHYPSEUDO_000248 [Phytophthora pseudosyringae]|uniref:Transmembrane protein n=1 Tax=Phytophthora pseudosyringae TaxID=221518 RepID=A0A8T1WKL8_9STRA|nr:hypothetical protein PHYPSEUDO_000248 [Phytophthora pseudosyringae]
MAAWPGSWWGSNYSQRSLHGPSRADAVYASRDTSGATEAAKWVYELQLARPLPAVDISRTPLSKILSKTKYQTVVRAMHKVMPALVRLNRVNILVFGSMLFLPTDVTRPWIPLLGAISLLPPLSFSLFFSLEILALLGRSYEFWFVSVLSIVNWVGIAQLLGDARALVCVSFWWNSQSVISIDANYRTYQTTAKSIVLAGPSMLALVVCCSYRLVVDSEYPSVAVGSVTVQWRQIVIFSASTLILFMFKKAFAKLRRRRRRVLSSNVGGDRHTIHCVVLRARMCLAPAKHKQRLRLTHFVRKEEATASSTQQLRLASHGSFIVDARNVLLPQRYLERVLEPPMRVMVYGIALTGLASTAIAWAMLLSHSEHVAAPALVAFVSSLVFVLITAALVQKDLLRLLVRKFDVLFSTCQATALALCLLDLLQWQVSSSLAVVTWWLWFVWVVLLDALTPSVTLQLRLRKLALSVIVVVLLIAGGCAVDIVIGGGSLFKSRLLFTLSLPKLGAYHEYTGALAVQRVVTVVGWNARLVFELALGDPNRLLFICRGAEYTSPFLTFSEPLQEEQQVNAPRSKRWRWKLRPVTVVPETTVQPDLVFTRYQATS